MSTDSYPHKQESDVASQIRSNSKDPLVIYEIWISTYASHHTRRAYAAGMKDFARYIKMPLEDAVSFLVRMSNAEANQITALWSATRQKSVSKRTMSARVSAIRSFCTYYRRWTDEGAPDIEPIKRSGPTRRDVGGLRLAQVRRMITSAKNHRNIMMSRRDYAVLLILFTTAIRRSELANIRVCDVDLVESTAMILRKGSDGARVKIELAPKVCEAIYRWLDVSNRSNLKDRPLFCHLGNGSYAESDREFSDQTVYSIVRRYLAEQNIEGGAHQFRRAAATEALDAGLSKTAAAALLGHASESMVATYDKNRLARTERATEILSDLIIEDEGDPE